MNQGPDARPVLLVHGLWNAKLWLTPLAWRLHRVGLKVGGFGYHQRCFVFDERVALDPHLQPLVESTG